MTYGFAALLQTINTLMPGRYLVHLEQRPELLAHITLALLAFSVLMIATLFTLLLAYLNHHLKSRKRLTLPHLPSPPFHHHFAEFQPLKSLHGRSCPRS